MIDVRRATESDAGALAEIAERTFRDTFADSNTADDMNLHCESAYGAAIQLREILDPRWVNLLAESGGALIGFAQLRLLQPKDCVVAERPSELYRIYVSREWHGKGVAQELMREALTSASGAQSDVMWLGVWERNPRAQAFYAKFGFEEVGEHTFMVGADAQRDVILARPVAIGRGVELWRWVEVVAGVVLFAWAGLSLVGSVAIMGLDTGKSPILLAAISLLLTAGSVWGLVKAVRLIVGQQRSRGDLLSPFALRAAGAMFLAIPILAIALGTIRVGSSWWSVLARVVVYVLIAVNLFWLASRRSAIADADIDIDQD